MNELEVLTLDDATQWESWLADNHDVRPGVWLKIAKKGSGRSSVTQPEALDTSLCYGWIDSLRRSCDETYYLQKYSPRRPGSSWSRVNVGKAQTLIAAGRMRPAGFAEIAAAKADGRWDGHGRIRG